MTSLIDPGAPNFNAIVEAFAVSPYARWMRLNVLEHSEGVRGKLTFADSLVGNPQLQILHGGVLATLLQLTGAAIVMERLSSVRRPRLLSCTVQYFAAARPVDTFCHGRIVSRSRRFATVQAAAFQSSAEVIIATATLQFQLDQDKGTATHSS